MTPRPALPFAFALALMTPACSSGDECTDPSTPGCVVTSGAQRIQSPDVSDAQLAVSVDGNTAFAMNLYQHLRAQPGNLFYSPFSVSSALAMAYAGARGDTEAQMASALGFSLPQSELHPAFNALDLALMRRGEEAEGKDGGALRLDLANALWGQQGQAFQAPFLDTLAKSYGAGMHVVDFAREPEPSRAIINDWVASRTEDRIEELLPAGTIDASTRLVLTNAVYFNAAWGKPFEAKDTRLADFTRRDGTRIQVETMSAQRRAPYAEGSDWAAVELPYDGNALSMVLVLPAPGQLDAFEVSLTGDRLAEFTGGLFTHEVVMTLPRFRIASERSLVAPLGKLGMVDAFTGAADFSGINGERSLYISAVEHSAFVDVNETGTEAAAATGEVLTPKSTYALAEIHFDRPYLFFIRDIATRTILFFGRVEDPQG